MSVHVGQCVTILRSPYAWQTNPFYEPYSPGKIVTVSLVRMFYVEVRAPGWTWGYSFDHADLAPAIPTVLGPAS